MTRKADLLLVPFDVEGWVMERRQQQQQQQERQERQQIQHGALMEIRLCRCLGNYGSSQEKGGEALVLEVGKKTLI